MRSIDRIDMNKKRPIPTYIKLILLVAVIFGISLRSCWKKSETKSLNISEIKITEISSGNVDVKFTVTNNSKVTLKKPILIRVFTNSGEELTSKITQIEIESRTSKRFLKVLQKFNIPLKNIDDVSQSLKLSFTKIHRMGEDLVIEARVTS